MPTETLRTPMYMTVCDEEWLIQGLIQLYGCYNLKRYIAFVFLDEAQRCVEPALQPNCDSLQSWDTVDEARDAVRALDCGRDWYIADLIERQIIDVEDEC